jgi:hypothetical protein
VALETISIAIDADVAQTFCQASAEDRRKIEFLLRLRMRELTLGRIRPLSQIMDEIGKGARARGLTPELLESMIGDE